MRLTVLVLALLGGGCVAEVIDEPGDAGQPRGAPQLRDAQCLRDVPPVHCAYLDVPVKRSDPGTGTASLFVTIVPAREPDGRAPVLVLAGGPGGTSKSGFWLNHPVRRHHDIVLMDQRGTGFSEPSLYCGELEATSVLSAGASFEDPAGRRAVRDAAARCRRRFEDRGIDLAAFNTEESAADVDDLRRALGAEQVNLHGASYGTRLALEVMRGFPEHVRSAALFGTYPPQVDAFSYGAETGDAALRAVLAACMDDPDCPESDPQAAFEQRMRELDEHPVEETRDDGSRYTRTSADVGMTLFQLLYDSAAIVNVPGFALGDPAPAPDDDAATANVSGIADGLHLAVICREEYPFAERERAERAPFYMRGFRWDLSRPVAECEGWAAAPAPARFREPVRSDVPTLLMVGRFDPITPPRYSHLAAETLERSQIVEVDGAGHDTQHDKPCIQVTLAAFLDDPSERVDTTCVDSFSVPDF